MLILRNALGRPLSWDEMDHNFEVLEINAWVKQGYERNQKCFVVDGSYTTIYNCVCTHIPEAYEPADVFTTTYGATTIWEPISSTYNGQPSNTDIYVTGMTYNSAISGNTLTVHQTLGYPDVAVFMPSYALYDHYVSNFTLTGTTLSIYRTGGQSTLTVDLQPIIDISTGITSTNTYVTGGTLNNTNYHLYLRRNDGVIVDINLYALHDPDIYTTGATLSGSIATFRKNSGSPYTLDLSALVVTGSTGSGTSGYSGFSGYSGLDGASIGSGYSGLSGYSGESNISGYSGISGWSGYSGSNGSAGTSGYSGGNGSAGTSGYSGISGATGSGGTGASGYSGRSGYSGYSGAQGLYGSASLILNGDGACTTDWIGAPDNWYTNSAAGEVITAVSGFVDNAFKTTYYTNGGMPAGAHEASYTTVTGLKYTLTFNYRSSVALDVLTTYEATNAYHVYATYAATTGTTSGVTLNFTAVNDAELIFGAGTGRTLTGDGSEWWMIDNVNLRCGSCTGTTGGSSLVINNNADTRVLTANGGTTSIDAESGLTYTTGYLYESASAAATFRLESLHTGSTSFGPVVTQGVNIEAVRGRGAVGAPKAAMDNDVILKQTAFAYTGTGVTHSDPKEIASITIVNKSNMNVNSPLIYSNIDFKMHSPNPATDTMDLKLQIDENGDTHVYDGLYARSALNLSVPIVYTSDQSLGTAFSYLANVTGSTNVQFTLPRVRTVPGRVYYICQIRKLSTGKLTLALYSGDTIHWQALSTVPFDNEKEFLMLQSDGVSNWIVLSQYGFTL